MSDTQAGAEAEDTEGSSSPPSTESAPAPIPVGAFLSAEYSRKYSVDVTASAKITAVMKSVPPPQPLQELIKAWSKPTPAPKRTP